MGARQPRHELVRGRPPLLYYQQPGAGGVPQGGEEEPHVPVRAAAGAVLPGDGAVGETIFIFHHAFITNIYPYILIPKKSRGISGVSLSPLLVNLFFLLFMKNQLGLILEYKYFFFILTSEIMFKFSFLQVLLPF